ncbi:MAG TPA: NAD(P)/FAD-dependent oxidoreductase [Polyangia bacterium]|nr:NAD(P)/FAD-dependent oxidoreductase [Polyangia bacterium]
MVENAVRHVHVAIAGSGFGGLGMAIRMLQRGMRDFLVFERAHEVGGVWRDNSYPGCACDVQSHLYSFSFAPNPAWSRAYSPAAEIHAYLRRCAERFGVTPYLRFGHEITRATWDGERNRWQLETAGGDYTADVFIGAMGALSEPKLPAIPGLASFGGPVFHSARWDHDFALAGKRVAVIGTGASAIQFVPQIQPQVRQLHVFQRTPPWIVPRNDVAFTARQKWLLGRSSLLQKLTRASIYVRRELSALAFLHPRLAQLAEKLSHAQLKRQVADPQLRARLTPSYRIGCKRVLVSDDYLPALAQPNVDVVTDAITAVTPSGVVTADGRERAVDAIICGTGFHVTDMPFAARIRGRDGRTLETTWNGSPKAHLGLAVHGFPNLFLLLGPNTGLGHSSVVLMMESQIEHVLGALQALERGPFAGGAIEPRAQAQAAFVAAVDARMRNTVWSTGGCSSWYLDRTGRNSTLWPSYTFAFRRRVARFDRREYEAVAARRSTPKHAVAPASVAAR